MVVPSPDTPQQLMAEASQLNPKLPTSVVSPVATS